MITARKIMTTARLSCGLQVLLWLLNGGLLLSNETSQRTGRKMRLFKSTWENPRPDLVVRSIDFEATHKTAAPFLIATTAEP